MQVFSVIKLLKNSLSFSEATMGKLEKLDTLVFSLFHKHHKYILKCAVCFAQNILLQIFICLASSAVR